MADDSPQSEMTPQAAQRRNNFRVSPSGPIEEMTEENACDYLMQKSSSILPKQYRKANLKDMRKALDKIAQYDKDAWKFEVINDQYEPTGKAVKYLHEKYYDPLYDQYDGEERYLRELKRASGISDNKPEGASFKDWKKTWPDDVTDQNRKMSNAGGKLRRAEQIIKFLTLYSTSDKFKRDYDNMLKSCKNITTVMHELYMEPHEKSEHLKRENPHIESKFSYSISSRVDPAKISFLLRDSAKDTKKSLQAPATPATPATPARGRQAASWKAKLGFEVN